MVKKKKDEKKAEGVFLRGGIYWIRWSDGQGRQIRESTGKDDFDFAKAWVESRRDAVRRGKLPASMAEIEEVKVAKVTAYTFSQLCTMYSNDESVTEQAYWAVKKYAVGELDRRYGHLYIKNLRPSLVLRDLKASRKKPTKANPEGELRAEGTVAKIFLCFSHMLSKGVGYGLVPQSILNAAHAMGVQNPTHFRTNWLRTDECQKLISACDETFKAVIVTAIVTGLRRGDVLRLKWSDADFRNGFLYVKTNKSSTPVQLKMSPKYQEMLESVPQYGEYMFMLSKDQMYYKDFRKRYATARKKAGIPSYIQFKDMRHTFASNLLNSGISLTAISRFLGHGSLAMTNRYSHLDDSHSIKAAQIMEAVFPDKEPAAEQEAA